MDRFARERQLGQLQAPTRLFVWPFEMMLRLQANMVSAIRESTESWAERRQEAADDAVRSFERLIHCKDIGEAVTIQQEWLEGTIQRVSEDFSAFANQNAAISRDAASSAREAGTRTFYGARAAARQVARAGESSHAEEESDTEGEAEGELEGTAQHRTRGRSRERHRK